MEEKSKPKIFSQTFRFRIYDLKLIVAFVQIWMFYEPADGREGGELKNKSNNWNDSSNRNVFFAIDKEKIQTYLTLKFSLCSTPILISSKFRSPPFEAKLVIFIFTLQGKLKLYWAMKLSKIRWVVRAVRVRAGSKNHQEIQFISTNIRKIAGCYDLKLCSLQDLGVTIRNFWKLLDFSTSSEYKMK